ncbi:Fe-S cluster assembly protein SufD [Paractinoplanes abujensis]|uniref:Fe-S cluster assembly protein SufD n=1 Tax=Paractinoplanes abujensis TaxID=882441 RepID=A0A7W7CT14_9ACTN|nr:Fe-S cluster assembly protein SufD [Actinoplanes abujensis]MBB4694182.1 Fe-S cluster assembly protein SufD [Actinoplanes abujensis]GID20603.1 Fe-S cluster assembly protein SufD [Actinoplanes abujensis]
MTTETTIAPPSTKSQVLRSFDVTEFPAVTGLEEDWRFTPIKRLRELITATSVTGTAPQLETGELPAGVSVISGATAEPVLTPFDRISALAFGSAGGVTLIEVKPESEPEQAVVIRLVGKGGEAAAARTVVRVGAFAKVTLVLEQTGTATLADNIEVVVGDSAQLTFVTVADWDAGAVQAQHVKIRLGRDARASHVQVALGGDLVRQFTSVEYTGRGGDAELWGLYFADAGQHFEHRQLVDHSVPDCRSYVGYRGALQGASAQTVWVGDVLIRASATGTETYEINRNLVLTDGAVAHSVPNLEIETGEIVGAGHASATGRFDEEQLFYLMARGIPEAEARKLVVRGFFAELINKIPVEELRERLGATIEKRLAESAS